MKSYSVKNEFRIVGNESINISGDGCLGISFWVKNGSLGDYSINSFRIADGDPALNLKVDYPGKDYTNYAIAVNTPGQLYVIRQFATSGGASGDGNVNCEC